MVYLGWQGDVHGYWVSRPFMTNVFSGVVGACFGIPIAIAIVGEVAARQRTFALRREDEEKTEKLFAQFVAGIFSLVTWVGPSSEFGARLNRDPQTRASCSVRLDKLSEMWAQLAERLPYTFDVPPKVYNDMETSLLRAKGAVPRADSALEIASIESSARILARKSERLRTIWYAEFTTPHARLRAAKRSRPTPARDG